MKKLLSILMVSASFSASAQSQDSIKHTALEEIVVTGQYEPQSTKSSVYKVRTITAEVIQARGATNLQNVLNTELNIRFSQDLALGGSNITMQGLSGQNVKILIDGVPMIGRQGTSNEINLNQINVNSIERIEIVDGPMSVVYGADALAGVINIITKKSVDGKIDLSVKVQEETVGKEYGLSGAGIHNQSLGLGYALKRWTFRTDLSRNKFGGYKGDSTGREFTWHPKEQLLASGVVGYRTDNSNVYYRLDYTNEDLYNPGNFYGSADAFDQRYISNRFMHQLQGGHTFSEKLNFTGAISYSDYERRTQSTTVNQATGDVRLSLGAAQQDVTKFSGLTLRGTFHYKINEKLSLQPGYDVNVETGSGGRIKTGDQSISDYAVFLSGEWKVSKVVQIRPGIRMIRNSVYDAPPAIPSINAKFSVSPRNDFRVSYARGFRAPSLRELYFNFFDASHSIEGNPNLQAELSHSFNASWNWDVFEQNGMKLTSVVGGFYNNIDNMITNGVNPKNPLVVSYINVDHYQTKGFTWTNTFKMKAFDAAVGFAYTGRFNQLSESINDLDQFNWSPEVNANVTYRWLDRGFIFSGFYKYTGTLPFYQYNTTTQQAVLTKTSGYDWVDLSVQKTWFASKSFMQHINVGGGVRNLLDVTNVGSTAITSGVHTTGGAQPIAYGRSFFLSLTYLLNK